MAKNGMFYYHNSLYSGRNILLVMSVKLLAQLSKTDSFGSMWNSYLEQLNVDLCQKPPQI